MADAAEIADVYLASWHEALPRVRRAHSDDQVRAWISGHLLNHGETWVARSGGQIVGFMTLAGEDLGQLYILPGYFRHGLGRRLIDLAKRRSPRRLSLYTFQCNAPARAFYESQGFRIADTNDGSRNEENEPDIRYEWVATEHV